MSSSEFSEWVAFSRLEPFGEFRSDLRNAMLLALIANSNRDPKKRKRPYEVKDFMPFQSFESDESNSQDAQIAMVAMLNAAMGGKDLREDGNTVHSGS